MWRLPSRRWRSAIFKVAAALAIASLAVAYQESTPRTQARIAGMTQTAELPHALQLAGHKGPVISAAPGDQGRWIVSAGADATLRIWSATTGAHVRTIELQDGTPTAVAISGRRAIAGYRQGRMTLWDLERGEKTATFQLGQSAITALIFASDPEVFAAASQDGAIGLFDMRTPSAPPLMLDNRDQAALKLAASESRAFVASAGADRTVRLWRADTHSLARTYRGRSDVTSLDLSADGRYVAVGGSDGSVRVWSTSSTRTIRSFKAHPARAVSVAFGPDRMLATSGDDGKVKVWNLRTSKLMRTLGGSSGPVRALHFTEDGRRVIGSGQGGIVRVWSLDFAPANGI